jgi:hypothetical protein
MKIVGTNRLGKFSIFHLWELRVRSRSRNNVPPQFGVKLNGWWRNVLGKSNGCSDDLVSADYTVYITVFVFAEQMHALKGYEKKAEKHNKTN